MKQDPTMVEIKVAAKKILKKRLVDLTVEDVVDFLIKVEKGPE